jgi:D-sedoheptulose 7-phosphate isomerase
MATLTSEQFKESVLRKCRESAEMKEKFFEANAGTIEIVCRRLAEVLDAGHSLFVMGNGGSSCDAAHVAVEFVHPIIEKRRAFPAFTLGFLPVACPPM